MPSHSAVPSIYLRRVQPVEIIGIRTFVGVIYTSVQILEMHVYLQKYKCTIAM